MSRGAALRYRREFDVSLGEWRALALLAGDARQSLIQLSRAAGLDKAQMSRVVASLTRRGLVRRKASAQGGRAIELSLTRCGAELHTGLIAAAAERDRVFRAALTARERETLDTLLSKLTAAARQLIGEETARSSGAPQDGTTKA
jgi:DNA-binding MarR family transcriptional regulator